MNPKIVELIYKMQSTPSVMEAITDFERIVKAKGLEDTGRMGKFVEMMKDKDVENALRKCELHIDLKEGLTDHSSDHGDAKSWNQNHS